jgi:hypothetical protein
VIGKVTFGNTREGGNEFETAQTAVREVQNKPPNSLLCRGYHDREHDRSGDPALV